MEWMVIWGVTQAAGFIFKPILEDLAKESAKDYAKDFFKDCLKKVIKLPEKDEQKEAYGKALTQFLQFFQQELDDADYQEVQIKQYLEPLKKFIEKSEVAAILGSAFEVDCVSLDTHFLAKTWKDLNLPFLPDEFSWERVSKRYLKKVKAIIQESEKLRPIFTVQTQSQIADDIKNITGIAPNYNLEKYAEGLREQYGNLKLESLDTTGVYYNELKLWKIFIAQNVRECQEFLPQVYEVPKDHIKRLREAGEDIEILSEEELERQRHRYINQQSQLVWQVIGDPTAKPAKSPIQQVVILGDPGAGKSSLLQYIALIWAERPLRDLSLYPLPLLLELRIYARDKQAGKCQDILSFIHGGNITCRLNQQQLHEKLRSGQAVALFDGIDEIFDPVLREEVVTDIHRFSNDYAQVQVIVTSRWLGYKAQRLRDAGFRHFMLQDLEIEQIEDFIERWHELTFTDQADKLRKKERLIKAIQDSKAIRELAGNPLLLTMMAILNRNQELPRDRPELYNQASRVLLHQWDVERALIEDARLDPKTIDYRDKQAMLRKVAYRMQSSEKGLAGNLISATDLEAILTDYLKTIEVQQARTVARLFINQLRTRNFILCFLGADSYGFVHRTFLEYFCAWEFVWQFKETQTLTIEDLINEVFGKHWQDESWHEVLRLICGMIESKFVAKIIDFLLVQEINRSNFLDESYRLKKEGLNNLILAANCLIETRNRSVIISMSDKLLKILKCEVEQKSPPQLNYETVNILCSLIGIIGQDRSDILLWFKTCLELNPSLYIPELAVKVVAEEWKDEPDTLPWLKNLAIHHEKVFIRQTAIKSIAENWKNSPYTTSFLKECALNDKYYNARCTALRMLANGQQHDSDTLSFLENCALNDQNYEVKRLAKKIIEKWGCGHHIDPFFDKKTIDEDSDFARFIQDADLVAMSQIWQEEPIAFFSLKNRVLHDEDENIRARALWSISKVWDKHVETFPLLKDRCVNDTNEDVRRTAVEAIYQGWQENSDTLPLLKKCALQDENWAVREAAVKVIAKGWKQAPDTLSWLQDVAQQDQSYPVRRCAVEAIIQDWKEESKLLDFLIKIATNDPFKRKYDFETNPRLTALEALLENFGDNPKTLEILNQVALNDSDEQLREFAVAKLRERETG